MQLYATENALGAKREALKTRRFQKGNLRGQNGSLGVGRGGRDDFPGAVHNAATPRRARAFVYGLRARKLRRNGLIFRVNYERINGANAVGADYVFHLRKRPRVIFQGRREKFCDRVMPQHFAVGNAKKRKENARDSGGKTIEPNERRETFLLGGIVRRVRERNGLYARGAFPARAVDRADFSVKARG